MTYDEARQKVHEAIGGLVDDDEFVVSWCLTIDVAGPDDRRYLAHRAGGGADGAVSPMAWAYLGMLQAAVDSARDQLREGTVDADDEEVDGDA